MDSPRFICDAMLGSLARWLRLRGFDTLYSRTISDSELINIARREDRIVLTRDTGIPERKGPQRTVLIHSNDTFGQLKEVLSALDKVETGGGSPRCTLCNGKLAPADRDAVARSVPEYVFMNATSFFTCVECGKVYWNGSHKKSIDSQLQKILGENVTREP
ncbi:MAG: Mut7-C RNAse domain-containing protein [Nitrospirae bacterium]|nr:Mut7-C RNAse domain-containing protein [Nitrospirota bacterium]